MTEPETCTNCGAPLPSPGAECPRCLLAAGGGDGADPLPPEAIADHFPTLTIEAILGQGGMGIVYRARHKKLDRPVALKVLAPEIAGEPGFAERFEREARTLARLTHPNIVTVHDFGESDGLYYLVMELVDGANLREILAAGRLSPEEALAIVPQICDALQYAHDQGVVHRDVKPENILVTRDGRVKILDFGLAKLVRRAPVDVTLTRAGQVMGTLHYMAPEQYRSPESVDHRADIYSLGVVFYEMLTGDLPMGAFPPPSAKAPVDARIDGVVLRALEQERERRWQHASDVKTSVDAIASGAPPAAPRRPRGRRILAAVAVSIALVIAAIAYLLTGPPSGPAWSPADAVKVRGAVDGMTDEEKAALVSEVEALWKRILVAAADPNPEAKALALSPLDRQRYERLSEEERKRAMDYSRLGIVFVRPFGAPLEDFRLVWVSRVEIRGDEGGARVVRGTNVDTMSFPIVREGGVWYPALGPMEIMGRPPEDGDRDGWLERVQGEGMDLAARVSGGPPTLTDVERNALTVAFYHLWRAAGDDILQRLGREPPYPTLLLYHAHLAPDGRSARLVYTDGEVTLTIDARDEDGWSVDPDTAKIRDGPAEPGDQDGRIEAGSAVTAAIRELWRKEGPAFVRRSRTMQVGESRFPFKLDGAASDYSLYAVALDDDGNGGRAVFSNGSSTISVRVEKDGDVWVLLDDDFEMRYTAPTEEDRDGWLFR